MIDAPKTLGDAVKYRYGCWAGNLAGKKYQAGICAMGVWGNGRWAMEHQCARKNGHGVHGLYCKQHAKGDLS